MEVVRCDKTTYRDRFRQRCTRKGVLQDEGKNWCKQHHPPTVKARSEERMKRWRAQWDGEERQRKRIDGAHRCEQQGIALLRELCLSTTAREVESLLTSAENLLKQYDKLLDEVKANA